jgi:Cof subfamily protein (haloacid dehalogenase superfamily)
MIKLVAIDIDGTLMNSQKTVSQADIYALKQLKETGVHLVLATGRPVLGTQATLEQLDFLDDNDYIISTNGAMISTVKSKEILYSSTLSGTDVLKIYEESQKHDLNLMAYTHDETLLTTADSVYSRKYTINNSTPAVETDFAQIKETDEFLLVVMPCDTKDRLDKRNEAFNQDIIEDYQFIRAHKFSVDISKKGTDKGQALTMLANQLNISMDEVMAIGDAQNDWQMISLSGTGVAMENASQSVKDVSDFITLSNDESGVAYAINNLILNTNKQTTLIK